MVLNHVLKLRAKDMRLDVNIKGYHMPHLLLALIGFLSLD